MPDAIIKFAGAYRFLSNFYPSPIDLNDGMGIAPTAEHAFQSLKAGHVADAIDIRKCATPALAKRKGRVIYRRRDWEEARLVAMQDVVTAKFRQNPDLAKCLLATKDMHLSEGNDWGDTFWGVCDGKGQNRLGLILMEVRSTLRIEQNAI